MRRQKQAVVSIGTYRKGMKRKQFRLSYPTGQSKWFRTKREAKLHASAWNCGNL